MTEDYLTEDDILGNPPPGVDLTLVGGQALVYWTNVYLPLYPKAFPPDAVAHTSDIDFVVQMRSACEECYRHWGGRLDVPGKDNHTPELGRLVVNEGTNKQIYIDFLDSLFRIERPEINRLRAETHSEDGRFKEFYILSEWGVLLNRINNTIANSRYRSPQGLKQLKNAVLVHWCRISDLLDAGDVAKAQSETSRLLKKALDSRTGMRIYLDHGIDLLRAAPIDDRRFHRIFIEKGLNPTIKAIEDKRERLTMDRGRRGIETYSPS